MLSELLQTARALLHVPGHTVPVIALLAAGIGANAAISTLFNALFLRDLPVREPERLAAVTPFWSVPDFQDFRASQKSFEGVLGAGSALARPSAAQAASG